MKLLSVVGVRPEFVMALPIMNALPATTETVLVHTGQHYDETLSDVFFEELDLPEPAYELGVGSADRGRQLAATVRTLGPVIEREAPDVVLVYGDTNSTLAGAVTAARSGAMLAHVEAGLRSFDPEMPEEVNRILTDHLSDLLLAPTNNAVEQLRAEGRTEGVVLVGDVTYDALAAVRETALGRVTVLDELGLAAGEYVLATVHRAGNTDDPERLRSILAGLSAAPQPVVLPVHPRTRDRIESYGLRSAVADSVTLVDPVGYLDFVGLLAGAERVATDSGGVQKEALFLEIPCVTLREETEWTETVEQGWNVLVGTGADDIARALSAPFDPAAPPTVDDEGAAARAVDVVERAHRHGVVQATGG